MFVSGNVRLTSFDCITPYPVIVERLIVGVYNLLSSVVTFLSLVLVYSPPKYYLLLFPHATLTVRHLRPVKAIKAVS